MNLLLTTCQNARTEWEKLLKSTRNNSLEEQPKVREMSWGGMGNLWDDKRQISIKEILLIKWWYRCLKIAIIWFVMVIKVSHDAIIIVAKYITHLSDISGIRDRAKFKRTWTIIAS